MSHVVSADKEKCKTGCTSGILLLVNAGNFGKFAVSRQITKLYPKHGAVCTRKLLKFYNLYVSKVAQKINRRVSCAAWAAEVEQVSTILAITMGAKALTAPLILKKPENILRT
jgi:hypothetical protein